MADRGPNLFTIPAHRAFADAFASGVIARHGADPAHLARGIILVPSNRAGRTIRDAFVRQADGHGAKGLLLPRLVPIGDPELDERLGHLFDPAGEGDATPPAIAPMVRHMLLARLVQDQSPEPVDAAEAMRLAQALGSTLDQLHVEGVDPRRLTEIEVEQELSEHWQKSLAFFRILLDRWPEVLAERGEIDLSDRRNRLLRATAARWTREPPAGFVYAAGISTTSPAVAALLRTVALMPTGAVVLADLDQNLTDEEWDAIGPFPPDPATGRSRRAQETHPQFALKLLLARMQFSRSDVSAWKYGSEHDARAARGRNISNAMLPPRQTRKWRDLKKGERDLSGIRAAEAGNPAEEAQMIAIALRGVANQLGRTAALVTPDRGLAERVAAHLRRWGIEADDSAGRRLSELPPGTLLTLIATAAAENFAPVSLLALLKHPLVRRGDDRLDWLEQVRALDLALRGPRPPAGLDGLGGFLRQAGVAATLVAWWDDVAAMLEPLADAFRHEKARTVDLIAAVRDAAERLSGDAIWSGHQGRAAADHLAAIEDAAPLGPDWLAPASFVALIERLLADCAVRPPQGGHPRIAIYGLIEARLQQPDHMILAGLNEGTWPALPQPDPWLAPGVRAELDLPGLDRRIGLSAHDFSSALGAPDVLITRARRDASAPAVASRFWLRLKAMSGPAWREDTQLGSWAHTLDAGAELRPAPRPMPRPPVDQRPRRISVTEVDRLKADPYAFYARRYLGLSRLDPVDADPSAAWCGTAVHAILEAWAKEDGCDPARLAERTRETLAASPVHPMMRMLWYPRLMSAMEWIADRVAQDMAQGRKLAFAEIAGKLDIAGVTLSGKADRIDRMADGTLAIVDYKTGKPPSAAQVAAGFSLQLGLIGLMAERGVFDGVPAGTRAGAFEYWTLQKQPRSDQFGRMSSPVDPAGAKGRVKTDDFVVHARGHFIAAVERWLTGNAPFTAKIAPNLPSYDEYDHLMRLEEWYGRAGGNNDG